MNPGQEQFFNFIMGFVAPGNEEQAKVLLEDCFAAQNDGTFSAEFLAAVSPKILALLKEEHKAEVKAIMDQFGSGHVSR